MEAIAHRKFSPNKLSELVAVGKDVLELLSSAMYVDPLTTYREYIQNAADAIDEAESDGLYSKGLRPRISISLDSAERRIKIHDNGIGVAPNVFACRLTAVGASSKRGSKARGFRGVGRFCGLAYCEELIFRSKWSNAPRVWEVHFDCRRLKELLADSEIGDLNDVMYEIVEFDTFEDPTMPPHFFEVELRKVSRVKDDVLLNEAALRRYLSQVGPVPLPKGFTFASRITKHLAKYCLGKTYEIYLNANPSRIERPFTNSFAVKQTQKDKFCELETFETPGVNGGIDAVGWILHHNYYGGISDRLGIKGLRLRLGNIQVGDEKIFESIFPELRFNSWSVGEVHIISKRLVPNGRRDDLEQSVHQQNLLNHITPHAKRIAKLCRAKSAERHQAKKRAPSSAVVLTPVQECRLASCRPDNIAAIRKILPILASCRFRHASRIVDALLRASS
jgi:hypothetical protein